jgi:hypothetical protein
MGIIKAVNEDKKLKGFKFKSEEELKVTEKKIISFVNFWNKIENFLVNNKVSIFIKEAFYLLFGVPYPEYLFSDNEGDYLVDYQKGKTEEDKTIVEFRTTPELRFALDVSKMWFWKKYYIRYVVNKTAKEYGRGTFRFKRILTYT